MYLYSVKEQTFLAFEASNKKTSFQTKYNEKKDRQRTQQYCLYDWICFYLLLTSTISPVGNEIIHGLATLVH